MECCRLARTELIVEQLNAEFEKLKRLERQRLTEVGHKHTRAHTLKPVSSFSDVFHCMFKKVRYRK